MPPPRKVDLLPAELRLWLQEELKSRGFGDYVALADALNARLEEDGLELRIGKSAIHAFGQEYEHFVKAQEQASAWAAGWMNDNGLEEEAKRHNVLFQMITTLAFKVMQSQMIKEGDEIDPRELHFLGKMLKDVMSSSGIREKLMEEERERIARETREIAAAAVEKHARSAGMTAETVEGIKAEILGVNK
ncbi:phage protein Gp27 family protein [Chachezhania antarctica]|uniref:phage protein Gp27 family protein n=1 Tax=Chachezhania antarctica TaxID=2340860 RepID=UPI000EB55FF3|nr:phage protein Gp27 family protein [Chachezhania antarctica]|tara:strand:- start:5363 stop:5932 length:570 start_codon:yes stop_codon:yes gene_type:complete